MIKKGLSVGLCLIFLVLIGCNNETVDEVSNKGVSQKIVSLNGAISEIICAIGEESQLVGVDVTSTYPASLSKLPKTGHNRNVNIEAIIALQPTHVFAFEESLKQEAASQLKAAGIDLVYFEEPKTLEGVRALINEVGKRVQHENSGSVLLETLDNDLKQLKPLQDSPRVLFIYARGAGALTVAGSATSVDEMLHLSGARNAAADVDGFKPYTSEAAIKANPDILLLFDSGLESLGGVEGLLAVPGIAQTNAGRAKRVYAMDGLLLSGFTPRTGKALLQLQQWFQEGNKQQ
jgi:iron complex transport system substrate-binding protein